MSPSDPLLGGKSVDAMLRLVWHLPSALTMSPDSDSDSVSDLKSVVRLWKVLIN